MKTKTVYSLVYRVERDHWSVTRLTPTCCIKRLKGCKQKVTIKAKSVDEAIKWCKVWLKVSQEHFDKHHKKRNLEIVPIEILKIETTPMHKFKLKEEPD